MLPIAVNHSNSGISAFACSDVRIRQALRSGTGEAGPRTRLFATALRLEPGAVDGADQWSQQQIRRAAEHHDRRRQQGEGNLA